MALRVDTWAAKIEDRPGGLAEKLRAWAGGKAQSGVRHCPPGSGPARTGVAFVTPITGAAQRAAKQAGFAKNANLHTARIQGPDKPGEGAAHRGGARGPLWLNVRGLPLLASGRPLSLTWPSTRRWMLPRQCAPWKKCRLRGRKALRSASDIAIVGGGIGHPRARAAPARTPRRVRGLGGERAGRRHHAAARRCAERRRSAWRGVARQGIENRESCFFNRFGQLAILTLSRAVGPRLPGPQVGFIAAGCTSPAGTLRLARLGAACVLAAPRRGRIAGARPSSPRRRRWRRRR